MHHLKKLTGLESYNWEQNTATSSYVFQLSHYLPSCQRKYPHNNMLIIFNPQPEEVVMVIFSDMLVIQSYESFLLAKQKLDLEPQTCTEIANGSPPNIIHSALNFFEKKILLTL